jgi:hypothetical protein
VHEIRDVPQQVPAPFPPAEEWVWTNGASPAIARCSDEWCDGAVDGRGRRRQVRLRQGVDRTASVAPLFNILPILKQNESLKCYTAKAKKLDQLAASQSTERKGLQSNFR